MGKFGFSRLGPSGRGLLGISRVRVAGESMSPTYLDGAILLVSWMGGAEKELPIGTVVVIEREAMPGILFIKRIQKSHSGAYWVEGDNRDPEVETRINDSRSWGYIPAHEVVGRVLFKVGSKKN